MRISLKRPSSEAAYTLIDERSISPADCGRAIRSEPSAEVVICPSARRILRQNAATSVAGCVIATTMQPSSTPDEVM